MLCDAGPLVALIDTADARHADCKAVLPRTDILLTTWPCFTEAMYLVGRRFGFNQQQSLWRLLELGALVLHESGIDEQRRMKQLMDRFQNVPMDLADASLVSAAELLGHTRLFTLDGDFKIYRINDTVSFDILP